MELNSRKENRMDNSLKRVGIVGYWYATNYGSVLTYYALGKAIDKMGYETLFVDRPEAWLDQEGLDVISRKFLNSHVKITEPYKWGEIKNLNNLFDTFVVGSDQVWTKDAMQNMRNMFLLEFADETKRKIAYAPSFGFDDIKLSGSNLNTASILLHKFNAISIREDSGKKILADKFMIDAVQNVDPVFLIDVDEYLQIANESNIQVNEEYILAYILDPTEDKELALKKLAEKLGKKVYIILDARKGTFEKNVQKLKIYSLNDVVEECAVEDWVYLFKNAQYIFTDSHHGLAMGIIFGKQLICYANVSRGYTRFTSLMGMLGIRDRLIQQSSEISEQLVYSEINYADVNCILNKKREDSKNWLYNSLKMPVSEKSFSRTVAPDFERCRMVVSMLRQYGIKHVVLSSGTRNLTLCRFFEANECFKTHMVIDERSAGFYGLGLALELKEPVAICCTSGTAASNYLTAVTEAYYQGVPLVVITADRYPCFQNNMEDQTIPQTSIFIDVCKKIVSLPIDNTYLSSWETRKLISEALLELDHHGKGPVQINVPLNSIQRKSPAKNLFWLWNYRYIERMDMFSSERQWEEKYNELKNRKRILVVYGQNKPLSQSEKTVLEQFQKKFNCVFVRDHLSNITNANSILSFPMINGMSQEEFNRKYAPDMIISMFGKRMLNDPVTFKLRETRDCPHWRIDEDGMVKDPYRKLSVVFEMDGFTFMKKMIEKSTVFEKNDSQYYNIWRSRYVPQEIGNEYNMKNIVGWTMKNIPENSTVHIAIGNTVMYANIFETKENVEVYCNMGTNGIDGCASTYIGAALETDRLAYLIIGDCSFFYDMNSLFNKQLKNNIRIVLINNNGAGLLRDLQSPNITQEHNHYSAKPYVESLGFKYISVKNYEELKNCSDEFWKNADKPMFVEVFCD